MVGNTYYVIDMGYNVYGWYTNGDQTYYLYTKTGEAVKNGWHTIDGKR